MTAYAIMPAGIAADVKENVRASRGQRHDAHEQPRGRRGGGDQGSPPREDEEQGLREGAAQAADPSLRAAGLGQNHAGVRSVIILFEGRDAAGKGGTIKALTDRVSPRVFRVTALPAPSDREKTQLYLQRYIERFPAAGEIVIFDRRLVQSGPASNTLMGFCSAQEHEALLAALPADREIHHRQRHLADQDLARGRQGRAAAAIPGPDRGSAAAVEAQPDGHRVVPALVCLLAGARRHAENDGQQARAVVYRALRRQAPRAPQLHRAHPEPNSVQENKAPDGEAPQARKQGPIRRSGEPEGPRNFDA